MKLSIGGILSVAALLLIGCNAPEKNQVDTSIIENPGKVNQARSIRPPLNSETFTVVRVESLVTGTLLRKNQPVANALILSCAQFGVIPGFNKSKTCSKPIELKTDSQGQFQFHQMTGKEIFTCRSPCTADPTSVVWFEIWNDSDVYRFVIATMGYGPKHVRLVCDMAIAQKKRFTMPNWPPHLKNYAPIDLNCDVKDWDS